jgi:hypothetical protein
MWCLLLIFYLFYTWNKYTIEVYNLNLNLDNKGCGGSLAHVYYI